MDVYLLSLGDHLPDPVSGRRVSQRDRLRGIVDMAVLAEEVGFTGVAVGEHHFHGYIVSAPELLLAAIADATTRLRLTTAVTLLAHADPVRVAEQLNTLDVLSDGRAEMTIARGVSSRTWRAFGLRDEDEVRRRLQANLQLLLRLLTEDEVTWDGESRPSLTGVRVEPRSIQRPRPPIWMGGGLSTRSAELAARHGLPLMLPSTLRPPESHLPVVEHYRAEMLRHAPGDRARVGLPVHVFVAPTTAGARATWQPHWEAYARFANSLRGDDRPVDLCQALDGPAVCGDPPTVAARLRGLREVLGLDVLLLLFDIGGLPREQARSSLALFGREVIPLLDAA
jgi:alkanesulfonate monooxygenase SsuD/methylene tetrahydromethanopterin reductase-like flavin-dependent oxidoreductase (luciferase family)